MSADCCPDCDAPLVTSADEDISETASDEWCAARCWRRYRDDGQCIREPVNWRARALAAEAAAAAAQAHAVKLREALDECIDVFGGSHSHIAECDRADCIEHMVLAALALPTDRAALDEVIDKAQRGLREELALCTRVYQVALAVFPTLPPNLVTLAALLAEARREGTRACVEAARQRAATVSESWDAREAATVVAAAVERVAAEFATKGPMP